MADRLSASLPISSPAAQAPAGQTRAKTRRKEPNQRKILRFSSKNLRRCEDARSPLSFHLPLIIQPIISCDVISEDAIIDCAFEASFSLGLGFQRHDCVGDVPIGFAALPFRLGGHWFVDVRIAAEF